MCTTFPHDIISDSYGGVCGEDTPSENPGWWGVVGTEVSSPEQCKTLDKRPGLTFLRYQQPADWNYPDGVSVVNATTVDWGTGGGSNLIFNGPSEARLRGWLHIPQQWNGTGEALHVCAGYSNISLALGEGGTVANLTAQTSACAPVDWPPLFPGRLSVDMHANDSLHAGLYPSHHHGKMELLHNKSQDTAKVILFFIKKICYQGIIFYLYFYTLLFHCRFSHSSFSNLTRPGDALNTITACCA